MICKSYVVVDAVAVVVVVVVVAVVVVAVVDAVVVDAVAVTVVAVAVAVVVVVVIFTGIPKVIAWSYASRRQTNRGVMNVHTTGLHVKGSPLFRVGQELVSLCDPLKRVHSRSSLGLT